jgi:phosphohistidine phosphatase SixA
MKHLFVVRHGVYDSNKRLGLAGKMQIECIGEQIQQILNGGSSYLMSSTAPRATDSSEILEKQLNLATKVELMNRLWTGVDGFGFNPNYKQLMRMVKKRGENVDGLVIVTHFEVAEYFPRLFMYQEFKKEEDFTGKVKTGQAVHINMQAQSYDILPKIIEQPYKVINLMGSRP